MIGEKSPFHSLTPVLANKRRKLVRTPVNRSWAKILQSQHAYSKRSDRSYLALEEWGGMVLQPQRKKLGFPVPPAGPRSQRLWRRDHVPTAAAAPVMSSTKSKRVLPPPIIGTLDKPPPVRFASGLPLLNVIFWAQRGSPEVD